MRSSKIRALIKLVEESNIDELEVSGWGRKVSIRKKIAQNGDRAGNPGTIPAAPKPADNFAGIEIVTEEPEKPETRTDLIEIKSPMVGTFYKAPAPDAKPYVEIGQQVKEGQVVCIIEAMKLMNEIESEISGRIVEILVENAKPVEFGQSLYLVDPS
jgi:acetyl-CoA carboxylase biotin carboxyl carrier protein